MKKQGILTITSLFVVGLFVVGGISIMATGSENDPLITKSYIDKVLMPKALEKIDDKIIENNDDIEKIIEEKMQEHLKDIESEVAKIQNGNIEISDDLVDKISNEIVSELSNSSQVTSEQWKVVTLEPWQTIKANIGTQLLLRLGSATVYSDGSVGIINLTTGTVSNPGTSVLANNLYTVTINNRGISAGAQGATVVICGTYTIS